MYFLKSAAVLDTRKALAFLFAGLVSMGMGKTAFSDELPRKDVGKVFDAAEAAGRVGLARKTKPVDARPATLGEVIETIIVSVIDGKEAKEKETQSKPALAGDMVVRNRCPETGNEQYLVPAEKFAQRYRGPIGNEVNEGWREYRPIASGMKYFIVLETEGEFVFNAPWGEDMIARSDDAIVQNPADPKDTYRVAGRSFWCTYEVH